MHHIKHHIESNESKVGLNQIFKIYLGKSKFENDPHYHTSHSRCKSSGRTRNLGVEATEKRNNSSGERNVESNNEEITSLIGPSRGNESSNDAKRNCGKACGLQEIVMRDAIAPEMPQNVVTEDSAHGEDGSISCTHRGSENSYQTPAADEGRSFMRQILEECTAFGYPISACRKAKNSRAGVWVKGSIHRIRSIVIANNRTQIAKGDADQEREASSDDASNSSHLGSLRGHASGLEVKGRQITKAFRK